MKLKRIEVQELFGTYSYDIKLLNCDYVTILHAPNGLGKTTILKCIKAIIEGDILYLDLTPFKEIKLVFDNDKYIKVSKENVFYSIFDEEYSKIRNMIAHSNTSIIVPLSYSFKDVSSKECQYHISLNRELIMFILRRYNQVNPTRLRHLENTEVKDTITLNDLLQMQGLDKNVDIVDTEELYEKLNEYSENLDIHMIESNRVYSRLRDNQDFKNRRETISLVDSIIRYSEELKKMITEKKQEYATLSERLDRTFPNRVLDAFLHNKKSEEVYHEDIIRAKIDILENRRRQLSEVALINNTDSTELPMGITVSEDTRRFLTTYLVDNENKLRIFDDVYEKLNLFLNIINFKNGFSKKKMKINAESGVYFELDNGKTVPLERLSSGEKNNFILYYELIFKCNQGSLNLIDEPEISLHISWQQEFIRQLIDICKINNMQAIVATHSPNIVNDYYDLLIDMEE